MKLRRLAAADADALYAAVPPAVGPDQIAARWDALPEPVRRYFRYAAPAGAPAIATARMRHDGFFRTRRNGRWMPIEGDEYFTVGAPGFVWYAGVRAAPLVRIEVRDCLIAGRGHMLVKVGSIFTIADARGPHIDQGAALRWLGEAVWFPPAFAANCIRWDPVDAISARATLSGDGPLVTALLSFDASGRLTRIDGERYRDFGHGRSALNRWFGRCSDYQDCHGFRIPASVEVAWDLPEGELSYARFHVTALDYDCPPAT